MAPFNDKKKEKKNPFSDRGLDKFAALVADLDQKKQRIYRENGSKDISFIRFAYSEVSHKFKPIIVKVKKQKHSNNRNEIGTINGTSDASCKEISEEGCEVNKLQRSEDGVSEKKMEKRKLQRSEELRKFCYRFLAVFVMILLFLVVYGRLLAILCTSMAWYCVPSLLGAKLDRRSDGKSSKNGAQLPFFRPSRYADVEQRMRSY